MLFRAEMMEKHGCLRSERDRQRPQRQVGDAVSYDVVDGAVEEFLTARRVGRSCHQLARTQTGSPNPLIDGGASVYYNSRYINRTGPFGEPDVTLDYLSIISDETSHIVSDYEGDRYAPVPWSDRWTVGTVARHVAGTHHVVAEVVRGRPDADFGLFAELFVAAAGLHTMPHPDRRSASSAAIEVTGGGLISQSGEAES